MSRTRRIYNSEEWKKKAIRHYKAKYENRAYYLCSMYGVTVDEAFEQGIIIYAGAYCYHPYAQLCMGNCHSCKRERIKYKRRDRRKNKLREKYYISEMYI